MSGVGVLGKLLIPGLALATAGVFLLAPQFGLSGAAALLPVTVLGGILFVASQARRLRVAQLGASARDLMLDCRYEEAIEVQDRLIAEFGSSTDDWTQDWLSYAFVSRAQAHEKLGRIDQAIALYGDTIARFSGCDQPKVLANVMVAMTLRATLQATVGRAGEATASLESKGLRLRDYADETVQLSVAQALLRESSLLCDAGQWHRAIAVAAQVVRELGSPRDGRLRELAAQALAQTADIWETAGEHERAVTAANKVVRRFGPERDAGLRAHVAKALLTKGRALGKLGHREAEVAAYEEAIYRAGDAIEPWACRVVGSAFIALGSALVGIGRADEAIATCDSAKAWLEDRIAALPGSDLIELAVLVREAKGDALRALGRWTEALAEYDEAIARLQDGGEAADRWAAGLHVRRGTAFVGLEQPDEAIRAYDRAIEVSGQTPGDLSLQELATAMLDKAGALSNAGRDAEARRVCDEIESRFARSDDPWIQDCLADARGIGESSRPASRSRRKRPVSRE